MATSYDDMWLFVAHGYGSLRQYCIKEQICEHDYGKVFPDSSIRAMCITIDFLDQKVVFFRKK